MSGQVRARSGLGGPGDVFHRIVHESRETRRLWRMLRSKLSSGSAVNNGTGGQRHCLFAGKPCGFNTMGGVTGTQRALESRTKEQGPKGRRGDQMMLRVVLENYADGNRHIPRNRLKYEGDALPEVEGLLE